MFFVLASLFLVQFTIAQDPWIEWGKILNLRCMENQKNENDCELLQDAFEEIFEKVAITVLNKVPISSYKLYQLTTQSPYVIFGERIVDLAVSRLMNNMKSETEIEKSLENDLITWVAKTAQEQAGDFLRAIKEDKFFEDEEVKKYLAERRGIVLDDLKKMKDEDFDNLNKHNSPKKDL
ncbi:hypothetical protein CL6EHI_177180A [Entamoeba histolytica]|uniref:Uncharacterized protein n=1 Tax=Entamoeba histolytica TaxID=5759 RepID=A0A175JJS5_ENTHI|nr:hypothetical protein CL6EHI_177180A [Entamoeba histolytica]